jgi:hypothetical protein
MEPDVDHARHIRTAVDTVVTVIITFSAMFLAKLRAAVRKAAADVEIGADRSHPTEPHAMRSHGRDACKSYQRL